MVLTEFDMPTRAQFLQFTTAIPRFIPNQGLALRVFPPHNSPGKEVGCGLLWASHGVDRMHQVNFYRMQGPAVIS